MNIINLLNNRDELIISRFLEIWESSVKKTHAFLLDSDIVKIKPEVEQTLKYVKQLYGYCDCNGIFQGFIGTVEEKIEMLFIDVNSRGKGIGKFLLNFAVKNLGVKFVDVNEQNEQGVGFYKHLGFIEISRSEYDNEGRRFPLLHLEYITP
ncbi:MAG: GNAT family N-acetyltransferase [Deltaproteobacteria bacterium]|jgi:putative acetyltransferase|nr:GNAT family N-acetyltransferase [Deltaproteobacteria bacterium]